MLKHSFLIDIKSFICLASLAFYAYSSVLYLSENKDMGLIMDASLLLIASTVLVYTMKSSVRKDSFYRRTYAPIFSYMFLWAIGFVLFSDFAHSTRIAHLCFFFLPLIIYPIAGWKKLTDEMFCVSMFIIMLVSSFSYYLVFSDLNSFRLGDDTLTAHLNASYLPVAVLPCVLLSKNKLLHIVAWLLSVILIFSSLKRGGIVALVLAFGVYMFFYVRDLKGRFSKFIVLIIGVFLTYYLVDAFISFDEAIGGISTKRFEGFLSGGYEEESRMMIIQQIFKALSNSDVLSLIIGHGYLSVSETIPSHYSAHNDFLEVLFDFGIIGFVFYCGMHLHFIKRMLFLFKNKSDYAPSYAVFYSLFLLWSLVSIVILYPMMLFLMIYSARADYLIYRDKTLLKEI